MKKEKFFPCHALGAGVLALLILAGCAGPPAPVGTAGPAGEAAFLDTGFPTIGIIGGVGWPSTLEYYRLLNETVRDRLGGLHSAQLLLFSIEFEEFSREERLAAAGDWDLMTARMVDAGRRLRAGGADFIIIASNTLNSLLDQVGEEVGLPVLHIADATAEAVRERGMSKVALLGTKHTMEAAFYRERLAARGIAVVAPGPEERDYINRVIFEELCAGRIEDESRQGYLRIIERLAREEGVEGVILGCTEIPLLVRQEDTPLPVFDTTAIHVRATVDRYLEGR